MQSIGSILDLACKRLQQVDSPRLDAEILLCTVLNISRTQLYTSEHTQLDESSCSAFEVLVEKRMAGWPVAYLIGEKEFWSLPFKVNPATLIPRPETEHLVEVALNLITKHQLKHIVDLGTGSGAIAIAIQHERPFCEIIATDISKEALHLAQFNAHNIAAHKIQFLQSDWYTSLVDHHFDLIVSNPPYIALHDSHLDTPDLRFEPQQALISGEEGLDALTIIIHNAPRYLKPAGWIALEHGYNQQANVTCLLQQCGFSDIQYCHDYSGNPRVTYARLTLEL